MLNEFLTHTLQIVIVLDVVRVIAWFVLAARRSPQKEADLTTVSVAMAPRQTLWGKLTGSGQSLQAVLPAQP
ncbi:MAG TPA: hypothetical protein EYQ31_10020 [Candidatus Handelsmanbacteria bacterium]|nr:hypothetical protein [Candidatus Handelsmanbacteria bacterium]